MSTIREQREARRLARLKRDAEICQMYMSGATLEECGKQYRVRRQRIKQIVKAAGLWRPRTTSGRDEFLGVNLHEEDKLALKIEADRQGLSMSALSAKILADNLPKPSVEEEIIEREQQLASLKEKAAQ